LLYSGIVNILWTWEEGHPAAIANNSKKNELLYKQNAVSCRCMNPDAQGFSLGAPLLEVVAESGPLFVSLRGPSGEQCYMQKRVAEPVNHPMP
jgi:hypothetical protein